MEEYDPPREIKIRFVKAYLARKKGKRIIEIIGYTLIVIVAFYSSIAPTPMLLGLSRVSFCFVGSLGVVLFILILRLAGWAFSPKVRKKQIELDKKARLFMTQLKPEEYED